MEAGMLHDLCKEMPKAQMEIWMRQLFPQYLDEPAAIWHGYLGSVFASRLYGCQDQTRALRHLSSCQRRLHAALRDDHLLRRQAGAGTRI